MRFAIAAALTAAGCAPGLLPYAVGYAQQAQAQSQQRQAANEMEAEKQRQIYAAQANAEQQRQRELAAYRSYQPAPQAPVPEAPVPATATATVTADETPAAAKPADPAPEPKMPCRSSFCGAQWAQSEPEDPAKVRAEKEAERREAAAETKSAAERKVKREAAKKEREARAVEAARAAADARAAYCGEAPKSGYRDLKSFYRDKANDPDSVEFAECSGVLERPMPICWVVACKIREKNTFGAKAITPHFFKKSERDGWQEINVLR